MTKMTDETEGKEFSFDGMEGSVTLADLGGFNMDEVEEFRFGENLPVGRYDFEVVEATLKTRGEGEKEKPFGDCIRVISREKLCGRLHSKRSAVVWLLQ